MSEYWFLQSGKKMQEMRHRDKQEIFMFKGEHSLKEQV